MKEAKEFVHALKTSQSEFILEGGHRCINERLKIVRPWSDSLSERNEVEDNKPLNNIVQDVWVAL